MAFLSAKFERYGLIDTDASPADRVYVADPHQDTEASLRQPVTNDEDPDGAGLFSGFRSELDLASADVSGVSQLETWMSSFEDVEMVGITPDHFVQWYNPSRVLGTEQLEITETNLAESMAMLVQDGGGQSSHGVYATRNGLLDFAPQNGGWADTDSNGTPDGYTETDLTSTAWNSGTYEAFVDTVDGSGSINAVIPFPVEGVDVTLSSNITQLHDDGTTAIRVEALDGSKSLITGGFTDKSVSATGRKFVNLTTPSNTHYLKVYPVRATGVSSNTAKFKVEDPCLRVDGSDQYVAR